MSNRPTAKIEFYQDKAGKHRWRLLSANGKVICAASQGYVTRADCDKNSHLVGQLMSLPREPRQYGYFIYKQEASTC